MSQWMIILAIVFLIISVIAAVMTLKITAGQSDGKNEKDDSIPEGPGRHRVTLNPIFLTYIFAAVLSLGYIMYWMFKT
ncbi:hypothetical protein [Jeotgalibacillus soli]|uniref:Uncharacterized protein n=1 Tax=Jeotgalibacillus soli TaxID=889306 RepID=A0A0C2R368_9BACL|nr:hypothetical protein [Jeotgalibacillus soli]KIL44705.1 hypothetical protein KP78_22490 [Jeotgalibacillus soli]